MKFYFYSSSFGVYGNLLFHEKLRYFDHYVNRIVEENEFTSTFEEFNIEFIYPPIHKYFKSFLMESRFDEAYKKLPNSTILRRYKRINVKLDTPEFAEHFQKHKKHEDRTPIETKNPETQYQNLNEIKLANIFIDKVIQAIELIENKLRSKDNFNTSKLIEIIKSIKPKITIKFLEETSKDETERREDKVLSSVLKYREKRKLNPKEKDTSLRDFRIYYSDFPTKAFYPYDYQYTEIFLNVLFDKGLKCPKYHHIYIRVAETIERALRQATIYADWLEYGVATINYEEYLKKTEEEKASAVFDFVCDGLRDIAKIDHFNIELINEAIAEIREKGLDTELVYKIKDHKDYKLIITFLARSMEEKCPIFFNIEDKATSQKYRKYIGKADKNQIWLWLQKISLTKKKIKIKSSTSVRANVILKGMKREMEFDLGKIMINKNKYSS